MAYDLENPHPGYKKDPNIINEYGHTRYPKWVKSKETGERILVESEEEEKEKAAPPEEPKKAPAKKAWQ